MEKKKIVVVVLCAAAAALTIGGVAVGFFDRRKKKVEVIPVDAGSFEKTEEKEVRKEPVVTKANEPKKSRNGNKIECANDYYPMLGQNPNDIVIEVSWYEESKQVVDDLCGEPVWDYADVFGEDWKNMFGTNPSDPDVVCLKVTRDDTIYPVYYVITRIK